MTKFLLCERCKKRIDIDSDGTIVNYTYIKERDKEKVWHTDHYDLDRKEGINRWQ